MTDDVLKFCKKYNILNIYNPGEYFVKLCNKNNKVFHDEIHNFESELTDKVIKCTSNPELISIGQIVAVRNESRLSRGIVLDIYKKYDEYYYDVLLIDYGKLKGAVSKVWVIEDNEWKNKDLGVYRIILSLIQPAILDINSPEDFSNGVLYKRLSDSWTPASYKYIESELKIDQDVYVKSTFENGFTILGDIYLVKHEGNPPVSLSQMLCNQDLAIFFAESKIISWKGTITGIAKVTSISDKVPKIENLGDGHYHFKSEISNPHCLCTLFSSENFESVAEKYFLYYPPLGTRTYQTTSEPTKSSESNATGFSSSQFPKKFNEGGSFASQSSDLVLFDGNKVVNMGSTHSP